MRTINSALQRELLNFVAEEDQNHNPRPLRGSLTAELLKQIVNGEREITGIATNSGSGDVFVRLSLTDDIN